MKTHLFLSLPLALSIVPMQAKEQPNILWIITDDHRADALGCWNMAVRGTTESELGYVSSPNIDKLASEGVLFTNSYCNCSASAPSRASMHTGRYAHHNGLPDFRLAHTENDFCEKTLPEVMREAGYNATLYGKLGVRIFDYTEPLTFGKSPFYNEIVSMEGDIDKSGVTDWSRYVQTIGDQTDMYEKWFYPDGSTVGYFLASGNKGITPKDVETMRQFDEKHHIIREPYGFPSIIGGESPMPTHKTMDGRIAEEFKNYLNNENRDYNALNGRPLKGPNTNQPQFINLGFHFPHTAVMPSKEYRDKYLDRDYKIPEFTQEEYDKMPAQVKGWQNGSSITSFTDEQKVQFIRDYYAFSEMGDQLLGEAVDEFKSYCARNDQEYIIVFLCGDHGWHLGEQGTCCKSSAYLKSNQTAVIAVSSDKSLFPAGKVVRDFVEYVDIFPTFASAAGFDVTDERFDYLDGRSLSDTADGRVKPREYVIGEIGTRSYIRCEDFVYSMKLRKNGPPSETVRPNEDIMWALEASREEVDMALFDLRKDPNEVDNIAYTEEYRELADWFRTKLGNIALGDNRIECYWPVKNDYNVSSFAVGSDDKKLDIPRRIIPKL
ncbi:MAG: sulfatase-like hydrolase/transferase [Rikenellaceae bacterium]